MTLAYTLTKYKDVYTIENTGVVNLSYTLSLGGCGAATQVSTGDILPNGTVTLPINYIDGIYQVTVSDSISVETLPDILFYKNFLLYIVNAINTLYCKCSECGSCKDCNNIRSDTYLNLLGSTNAYMLLDFVSYEVYLKHMSINLQCDLNNAVANFVAQTQISGDEEILDVMNKIIASYYTSFYMSEVNKAIDTDEVAYVKWKYNYVNIAKCFKKIGIDVQTIVDSYSTMNVFYWQQPDITTDIDDVMANLTQVFLDAKPVVNISDFQQGKKVTYAVTGRNAFAIQETPDTNYIISDSMGNDITDEFDYQYDVTLKTAVFVSINSVAPSVLYYKFKTNL